MWVQGVSLDLLTEPIQPPQEVVYRLDSSQESHLNTLVQELVERQIVVECPQPKFLAGLFLRPKPDDQFRLIIDLSPLNELLKKEHFKMDNLQQALDLMEQGDYMCKVDLKNAYYSVPIDRQYQPYLAFLWRGRAWMFTRLCFGLSPAPRIFTKVMKPLLSELRRKGAKLVVYIDDFWICHRDKSRCRELLAHLITRLQSLGFVVNHDKSVVEPVQRLVFLGMDICSTDMTVSLPDSKRDSLLHRIRSMRNAQHASPLEMASLLGRLEAIRPAFTMTPLYYRSLQQWAVRHQTAIGQLSCAQLPLQWEQLEELRFWEQLLPKLRPQKIVQYRGSIIRFQTDASLSGWGVKLGDKVAYDKWSQEDSHLHINVLELLAIFKGLKIFASSLKGQNVLICGDNTTSLAYIRKMGGTRSALLTQITIDIWELAQSHSFNLEVEHVPGEHNQEADYLSRLHQVGLSETTEWRLNRGQFNRINSRWGPLRSDLFASHSNTHLPDYITWMEPHCRRNAFHHQWEDRDYAFPPFALLGRVLRKVHLDKCTIVLVAPKWETQSWFPLLRDMLWDDPMDLPYHKRLLRDQAGNPHPLGYTLRLTVWPISGDASKRRAYLGRSRTSW